MGRHWQGYGRRRAVQALGVALGPKFPCTERLGEHLNGSGARRTVQKVQRCIQHLGLARSVAGRTEGSPHREWREESARHGHAFSDVGKRLHHHRHGGDARLFDRPCNVPDRHVAYRSDGDEQQDVGLLFVDHIDPARQLLSKPALGSRAREGEHLVGEAADSPFVGSFGQSIDRERNVAIP